MTQFWSLVSLGLCYDFWNKQTHLFLLRFFFFPLWVEWRARLTQTKSRTSIDTFKAERRPGYLDGRQQCNELSRKSDSFATETESAQSTGMRWLTLFLFRLFILCPIWSRINSNKTKKIEIDYLAPTCWLWGKGRHCSFASAPPPPSSSSRRRLKSNGSRPLRKKRNYRSPPSKELVQKKHSGKTCWPKDATQKWSHFHLTLTLFWLVIWAHQPHFPANCPSYRPLWTPNRRRIRLIFTRWPSFWRNEFCFFVSSLFAVSVLPLTSFG